MLSLVAASLVLWSVQKKWKHSRANGEVLSREGSPRLVGRTLFKDYSLMIRVPSGINSFVLEMSEYLRTRARRILFRLRQSSFKDARPRRMSPDYYRDRDRAQQC